MKKIKVGKNKFALIDKEDFENINQNSWHIHKTKHNFMLLEVEQKEKF